MLRRVYNLLVVSASWAGYCWRMRLRRWRRDPQLNNINRLLFVLLHSRSAPEE